MAGSIDNLFYLRLLALVILVLLGWILHSHFVSLHIDSINAVFAAAFICSLPCYAVYVSWASAWLYLVPAPLTFLAYRAVGQGLRAARLRSWLLYATAVAILYACFNIYPPSTMFILFWITSELLMLPGSVTKHLRRYSATILVLIVALSLYYGIYRLTGYHHPRSALTADPIRKAVWFVKTVLPSSARLQWFDSDSWMVVAVVLGSSTVAILTLPIGDWIERGVRLALVGILLPAAYLPILAVQEFDVTFRSQIVLASIIALASWLGLSRGLDRIFPRSISVQAFLALILLIDIGKANHNLLRYVILPNSFEYSYLKSQMPHSISGRESIVLIQVDQGKWLAVNRHWDEFRVITSVMPLEYHMLPAMAALILRDSNAGQPASIVAIPADSPIERRDETVIIDMAPVVGVVTKM
jgi:hypothetical protein